MEGLDVNQTLGGVRHSSAILSSTTFAQITLGLPQTELESFPKKNLGFKIFRVSRRFY